MPRPVPRRLKQLDRVRRSEDLHAPPANRLEQLKGARAGQRAPA
jgi:plasmid maintenance system killer protein